MAEPVAHACRHRPFKSVGASLLLDSKLFSYPHASLPLLFPNGSNGFLILPE